MSHDGSARRQRPSTAAPTSSYRRANAAAAWRASPANTASPPRSPQPKLMKLAGHTPFSDALALAEGRRSERAGGGGAA